MDIEYSCDERLSILGSLISVLLSFEAGALQCHYGTANTEPRSR